MSEYEKSDRGDGSVKPAKAPEGYHPQHSHPAYPHEQIKAEEKPKTKV
jgi:hypothetical protein